MAAYHFQQGDRPLDGYTIQYAIGRGGFGEVYFAVSDSGREVALKAVQNFEEVELRGIGHCMNLKSPQLVMIFDVRHAADGTPWVIMEYVAGPSLRDILDESPDGLAVEQAQFFLKELAKGLSYLHEAGVVHRDLKPHNVFFEDGLVKIGDYSLSKVITNSHRSGNTMTVGSVHYMAPEISLGRYDRTVDIYALGVMLHEMLTGEPPYIGESMGEVLMKHLSSEPDVSQVPEPFAGVIVKAMQRDPADRFQTAEEMMRAVSVGAFEAGQDDSFNPITLSLVGERAQQAKVERAATAVAATAPAAEEVPGITAPTASVGIDTSSDPSAETDTPPGSQGLLHRTCLHYEPSRRLHDVADPFGWPVRILLSVVSTLMLILLAAQFETDPLQNWWSIAVGVLMLVASSTVATAAGCRWLPMNAGLWPGIVSRFSWLVCAGLPAVAILRLVDGPSTSQFVPIMLSVLGAVVILDWRCLIAPDRQIRVATVVTLAVGVAAATIGAWIEVGHDIHLMSAAAAMAMMIAMQLLAPLRSAAPDAPLIPRQVTPARPRLLYDGPAMFLELIVAASAALFLLVATTSRHGEPVFITGLLTFLIGGLALRFRLHRRAWPERMAQRAVDASKRSGDVTGRVEFDWFNVLLELLVAACGMTVLVTILEGDEDYFVLGAGALVFGILALRLRSYRRRARHSRDVTVKSSLSFDPVSVFLELLVGVCVIVGLLALVKGNTDDAMFIGGTAAALGFVALRFRLARRVPADPPEAVQERKP